MTSDSAMNRRSQQVQDREFSARKRLEDASRARTDARRWLIGIAIGVPGIVFSWISYRDSVTAQAKAREKEQVERALAQMRTNRSTRDFIEIGRLWAQVRPWSTTSLHRTMNALPGKEKNRLDPTSAQVFEAALGANVEADPNDNYETLGLQAILKIVG